MENLVTPTFWSNRRVLITGHTGFKGGWLALWLSQLGARIHGFALPPATDPNLFQIAQVERHLVSILGDVRERQAVDSALSAANPEIIFHLAAQPLVKDGYLHPVDTYATNVMGTVHLLEAARQAPSLRAIVVVTTDKCYENKEWSWPYRENESLGGVDPYSSSKACVEMVTNAYRCSFLDTMDVRVATARAGNVFGGGDWSPNRLVPDLLNACSENRSPTIRNPQSVRPWQHVLEPLAGYLMLAEALWADEAIERAWNFGPAEDDCREVGDVADIVCRLWGNTANWQREIVAFPHEAGVLRLDASHARQRLKWRPRWTLTEGLEKTVSWHKAWLAGQSMSDTCRRQIEEYCNT